MADVGRHSGAALRGFGTVGARPLAALHRHLESAAGWPLAGCAGGLPHPDRRDGGGCGLGGGPRIWRLAESRNGHLGRDQFRAGNPSMAGGACHRHGGLSVFRTRSEEHTSELQSLRHLVCRLLLEKKKKANNSSGSGMATASYMIKMQVHTTG